MRHSKLMIATGIALLCGALSAQAEEKTATVPATQEMMKGHDMMAAHHGAGQADKGHRCMHKGGVMMNRPMPHMVPLPALPPGNEKLEVQMQAEILQKVGEILAKYAGQVKDTPATP
jgi:hypothetical protein